MSEGPADGWGRASGAGRNPARPRLAGAAALALWLAACTPQAEPRDGVVASPPAVAPDLQHPAPGAPVSGGVQILPPDALLAEALADASRRSGIEVSELVIEKSARVTWNDGALGCPEPGMNYTQALVPGWHLVVRAADQVFDYRSADRGRFMLCPAGRGQPPHLSPEISER